AGGTPRRVQELQLLANPKLLLSAVPPEDADETSGDQPRVFDVTTKEVELSVRYVAAAGEIKRSLAAAAADAGLPPELLDAFADVFTFDVDFARNIHRGDRFEVVYEVLYDQSGVRIGVGDVLFAALTWNGGADDKAYYRFTPSPAGKADYFGVAGDNPRTLLMKTPVRGARVTSPFGLRAHPIHGYTAAHKGVDFGAPVGTPILAAGDGVVSIAGWRGTFGKYIRIRHNSIYETAYAHLHGFAKGIKPGKTVKQGDVIGYLGNTGSSTGPHLHYEVLSSGVQLDPQTVLVATGERLKGDQLDAFFERRDAINALRIRPFAVVERTVP
ncbi:MAG: M23 family metallopeptidase, partial [Pseudomonadota bacterium]